MKPSLFILIFIPITVFSQPRTITSRILDSDSREPIKGATVYAGEQKVISNHLGYFQVVTDSIDLLDISHISYQTSQIRIPNIDQFLILLEKEFVDLGTIQFDSDSFSFSAKTVSPCVNCAKYPGGWEGFKNALANEIITKTTDENLNFDLEVYFKINEDGQIEELIWREYLDYSDSDENVLDLIFQQDMNWTPALQNDEPTAQYFKIWLFTEDKTFTMVESQPRFPGGMASFYQFVANNMDYPSLARRTGVEGRVYVQFVVNKEGKVTDLKAVRGIGAGCDEEAVRIVSLSPEFIPGKQNGVAVPVRMVLPIVFRLDHAANPVRSDITLDSTSVKLFWNSANQETKDYFVNQYYSVEAAIKENKYMDKLSLVNLELDTLTSRISELKRLKYLDLENNQLSQLPKEITSLSKLEELYMPFNLISSLPKGFSGLDKLAILSLASNQLVIIPKELMHLSNLEILDLSDNEIYEIPKEIALLKKLRILVLNNTKIDSLPNEIYTLKHLEKLYLSGTGITDEYAEEVQSRLSNTDVILH